MPGKLKFTSNIELSLFAYLTAAKPPKEKVAKVAITVLSTTAKAKAREKRKAAGAPSHKYSDVAAFLT